MVILNEKLRLKVNLEFCHPPLGIGINDQLEKFCGKLFLFLLTLGKY